MAMTLRLSPEQDAALSLLAQAHGTSKQEAATRAIVETAARTVRSAEIRDLARREVSEYRALDSRVRRARGTR
ncbi:CopG family transcriptional regulator [Corynebacterium sp. TAE3-ERU12]|uniref:CopG family transcriptional regulator n=1 Tax=Corynebacterium sp. TAE3-ERU12 TaxID=2849491 RepID=UPI001C45F72B|nr:CopG family transcriptional regulator [Corynebacterium sp. TAE3-ERU12]MBV7294354.1 CopG family transcriptional regulator [Corynebacterium sp. TAE3-ERU12]